MSFRCARCDRCCYYDYSDDDYSTYPRTIGVCPNYHAICGKCLEELVNENMDLHNFLVNEYHYDPMCESRAKPIPSLFCYHCCNVTKSAARYKALLRFVCDKYGTSIGSEESAMDMNIFVCQNCIGIGSDGLDGDEAGNVDKLFEKYAKSAEPDEPAKSKKAEDIRARKVNIIK